MKIDYVAKSRTENYGELIFLHPFVALYICYSCWTMSNTKGTAERLTVFLFLIAFLVFCMFKIMEPDMKIVVEEAKKFLENTGQEATSENINLLLNRYYKGNWPKIEDMLYEKRTVFSVENIELVSGNISENSKEALPVK